MTLQTTPEWKTYKRHLRAVINHHISQAIGDLSPEERELTEERVKQVTKRLDTYVATYMLLSNIAQKGKKNAKKFKSVENPSRPNPPSTGEEKE